MDATREAVVDHFKSMLPGYNAFDPITQQELVETKLRQLLARQADEARPPPPPPPAPEPLAGDTTLRTRLAAAQDQYQDASDALTRAQVAAERSQRRVDEADALLKRDYADLDQQVDAELIKQIKAGHEIADLPADLLDAQTARGKLIDRITAERRALVVLQREVEQAEAAVGTAARTRAIAARSVLVRHCTDITGELQKLDEQATRLRLLLLTVAHTWFADCGGGPPPLTNAIRNALHAPPVPATPDANLKQRLLALHKALCDDADQAIDLAAD